MGAILAAAIYAVAYRFLSRGGVSPLWNLGISLAVTFLIYPVIVVQLDGFLAALSSGGIGAAMAGVAIVGFIAFAAYTLGHRRGASGGSPFKPF